MKVIEYLNTYGVEALKKEFAISIREYEDLGIMTLNYSQLDSPKHNEIVKECRALILSTKPPYTVVSRAFDRFFNYNECPQSNLFDTNRYMAWEKLDGSLMPVYYHQGEWRVATRKMALAEGVNTQGFCFNDIFRNVVNFDTLKNVNTDLTLIFEMVSPKNRIVKRYDNDDVFLLGVRNHQTGVEFKYNELVDFAKTTNFKLPQMYKFTKKEEVFNFLKEIDPFDEGFVCIDYDIMHRIKIKNPSYMAIAHLRDNGVISPKRIALLVMTNDHEEYLNIFPEDYCFFEPYINAQTAMLTDIREAKNKYFSIADQKEFALAIQHLPIKPILFQLRKGYELETVIDRLTMDAKLEMLNNYRG